MPVRLRLSQAWLVSLAASRARSRPAEIVRSPPEARSAPVSRASRPAARTTPAPPRREDGAAPMVSAPVRVVAEW